MVRYQVQGKAEETPMTTHTGISTRLTPTSRMSRKRIMTASVCWLRRRSVRIWSVFEGR